VVLASVNRDLGLKTRREKEVFQQLKNKDFIHTPTLDPILLQETGMDTEFDLIFQIVGWTNFWDITELGSRLLTIEFLCNLQYYEGESLFGCSNRTLCCLGENRVTISVSLQDASWTLTPTCLILRGTSCGERFQGMNITFKPEPVIWNILLSGCSTNGSGPIFSIAMILEK